MTSIFIAEGGSGGGIRDWPDVPGDISSSHTLTPDARVHGALEPAGDADWYRVEVTKGTTYQFTLAGNPIVDGPLTAGGLEIRTAKGRLIDESDGLEVVVSDLLVFPPNVRDDDLSYTATRTETIFVAVRSETDGTGDYWLKKRILDVSDDHSNVRRGATRLEPDETVKGSLDWNADEDVFKFRVEADETYRITLRGDPDSDSPTDRAVYTLQTKGGRSLGSNHDGADGLLEVTHFTAEKDRVVLLEVSRLETFVFGDGVDFDVSDHGAGDYELSVEMVEDADEVWASRAEGFLSCAPADAWFDL